MAGSFRSRIFIAVLAGAVACSAACVAVATSIWRRAVDVVGTAMRWLAASIPRRRPEWLMPGWDRVRGALGLQQLRHQSEPRRPQVSPRWRMCPST